MTALQVSGAKLVITDKIRSGKFEHRLYEDGHLEDVILVNPKFNDMEKLVIIYHELGHLFTTSSQFASLKAEVLAWNWAESALRRDGFFEGEVIEAFQRIRANAIMSHLREKEVNIMKDVCSTCMKKFDESELIKVNTPLGVMKFCLECIKIQLNERR